MNRLRATEGRILFRRLIFDSLSEAGYSYSENDDTAVLVWYDSFKKIDFFGSLHQWQIVNRLPKVNVLCRKAPMVRLIQRTAQFFPSQYTFLPKSYILPIQRTQLLEILEKEPQRLIIKPDRGSLGEGITIIEAGDPLPEVERLSVAQEYIHSFHLDGFKFDLRIYALIASVDPLIIYVFRDGVARFCSKKYGEKSIFSELTNKTLNKKNPEVDLGQIVKMIKDVFIRLSTEGIDTNILWKKIDQAIVSTIITSIKYLSDGQNLSCPNNIIQRSFQILGFDIILDQNMNPYVLEVNYRPSLQTCNKIERDMKKQMLKSAMQIVSPTIEFQNYILENYSSNLDNEWENRITNDFELKKILSNCKPKDINELDGFVKVFPIDDNTQMFTWKKIINTVYKMPSDFRSKHFLPSLVRIKTKKPVENNSEFLLNSPIFNIN